MLCIYINDGIISAKSNAEINQVIAELGSTFKVKDPGPTEWLLVIKIEHDSETRDIHLSQCQYAVNMLEQYGMSNSKPVHTLMIPGLVLTKEMGAQTLEEASKYGIYFVCCWLSDVSGSPNLS
jgi:hypothetical protein